MKLKKEKSIKLFVKENNNDKKPINGRKINHIFYPKSFRDSLTNSLIINSISSKSQSNIFKKNFEKIKFKLNEKYISNNLNNFLTKRINQNRILYKIRNKKRDSEFYFEKLSKYSLHNNNRSNSASYRYKNIFPFNSNSKLELNHQKKIVKSQNMKSLSFFSQNLLGIRKNPNNICLKKNLNNNIYYELNIYKNEITSNLTSSISNSNIKKN